MAYQMAATAVTLNDLEGYSLVASLFKCNISNIYATFYSISTDSVLARFLCISRASCSVTVMVIFNINKFYRKQNAKFKLTSHQNTTRDQYFRHTARSLSLQFATDNTQNQVMHITVLVDLKKRTHF